MGYNEALSNQSDLDTVRPVRTYLLTSLLPDEYFTEARLVDKSEATLIDIVTRETGRPAEERLVDRPETRPVDQPEASWSTSYRRLVD